jgi:Ribonuclease toxin, BrnT, of type II toxin-antitoxin system
MHTAFVEIEFDPAKAQANLRKHKVSFAHAKQALRDPLAVTIEDPDAVGERRLSRWAWMPWAGARHRPHAARRQHPAALRAQNQS